MTDEERERALAELLKKEPYVLENATHEELIELIKAFFPEKEKEDAKKNDVSRIPGSPRSK